MHWIDLHEMEALNLVPSFLKEELAHLPETVRHIISRE